MEQKKSVLSGIQPSGGLTLGNYIGALRNWASMQDDFDAYYCVVNMHAITVRQDPDVLRRRTLETMALLIACGIEPERSTMFIQSNVREHAELNWVLCCNTYMGELNRMTQFKDKSARHADNINAGLYTYPVLMAADILLYQADLVPVGADQRQHLEVSRDIAIRFNNAFGETFTVPEAYIPKVGGRIMSLQDPTKKMSKSDDNPNGYIALLDTPDDVLRKCKRAVTDSENCIAYDENRPGVSNLLSIYSSCADESMENTVKLFEGKGYGALKAGVADAVIAVLEPLQKRYYHVLEEKTYLNNAIAHGAQKAGETASKTLAKVYERIGFDAYRV
ncbi:tryptophan--tRNA ligase [Christensenellaceae bacterium OttesenSCG-928-L17]|nr:tryptophan--tRNA ligase [Christensenellaceae bacterium OttesenSCG-928-L17]